MPRLSTCFIRASLVYLFLGFTWGALMLIQKGFPLHPLIWRLFPAHIDFMLLGWTTQLVMGVAYWILPRFSGQYKRGNPKLPWLAFYTLNVGILVDFCVLFLSGPVWIRPLGNGMKLLAVLAFALHAWPRIKSFKRSS